MNIIQEQYKLDSLLYQKQVSSYNREDMTFIDKKIEKQVKKINDLLEK